jgi:hypothetical protein
LGYYFRAGLVVLAALGPFVPRTWIGEMHLAALDATQATASVPGPTFTFTHVIAPHYPYVLDRDGQIVRDAYTLRGQWGGNENKAGYLAQVEFLERRLVDLVDGILAESPVRPVIVIQGDHGSWSTRTDRKSSKATTQAERLGILNVWLVPPKVEGRLYPTISPVNTFRLLGERYLGWDAPLLDDRSIYGEGGNPATWVAVPPELAGGR